MSGPTIFIIVVLWVIAGAISIASLSDTKWLKSKHFSDEENIIVGVGIFVVSPLVAACALLFLLYYVSFSVGSGFAQLYRRVFPKRRITLPRAHARKVENG